MVENDNHILETRMFMMQHDSWMNEEVQQINESEMFWKSKSKQSIKAILKI